MRYSFFEEWFAPRKLEISLCFAKRGQNHPSLVSMAIIEKTALRPEVLTPGRWFQVLYLFAIALGTLGWVWFMAWGVLALIS